MDLALALVDEDHGAEVALQTARMLVVYARRPGGQAQFSVQLAHQLAEREPIRELQAWIGEHLDEDLSVAALAGRVHLSERQFARVFRASSARPRPTTSSGLRVERARSVLETGSAPLEAVARRCGFAGAEVMRRAFQRRLGTSPSEYRPAIPAAPGRLTKRRRRCRSRSPSTPPSPRSTRSGPTRSCSGSPGAEVVFCSSRAGRGPDRAGDARHRRRPRPSTRSTRRTSSSCPAAPGPGSCSTRDGPYASWIAAVHETTEWTTSVCTGSLLLAAAGILDGVDATTHWAVRGLLGELGANPVAERVVERGKVMTAAGVSSGIDMALTLAERIAGTEVAQAIQLGIEYDPDPPHDTGSLEKAPQAIVEMTGIALVAEDGRAVELHSLGQSAAG